jgi:polysaccharide biosynthesis protein PslG
MRSLIALNRRWRSGVVLALPAMLLGFSLPAAGAEQKRNDTPISREIATQNDHNPWGMATGAEWLSAYPQFDPLLDQAGVKWLRAFKEWHTLEPKHGYWNWAAADHLVEDARTNNLRLTWVLGYFAPWASADGGTGKFPIKDIQYWRDYVGHLVERYHRDIQYWEVWNEFNGGFAENGTPERYAELVREASIAAKAIDPSAKIGLSVANFDLHFLDAAIKAGAAGYFDYVCVHPYEKMAQLESDGEIEFLAMAASLRQMLAANHQPSDMPLWITEIGETSYAAPDQQRDRRQSIALAKSYILSLAAGFQKIFWFEARGPSHDGKADYGIIRSNFTLRPSYAALKTLSAALGPSPISSGWLELGQRGFSFLFAAGGRSVLAAWAPSKGDLKITFPADVRVLDLAGNQTALKSGEELTLTRTPILLLDLPEQTVRAAEQNRDRPYPWGGDYAQAQVLRVKLGAANVEDGIKQVRTDSTLAANVGNETALRMNFAHTDNDGHYAYFSADPGFVKAGAGALEITVLARRLDPGKLAGFALTYESKSGYVGTGYANIPESDAWHELAWKIDDADFAGQWGYNFALNAVSSPNEFLIKEVAVKRRPR